MYVGMYCIYCGKMKDIKYYNNYRLICTCGYIITETQPPHPLSPNDVVGPALKKNKIFSLLLQ